MSYTVSIFKTHERGDFRLHGVIYCYSFGMQTSCTYQTDHSFLLHSAEESNDTLLLWAKLILKAYNWLEYWSVNITMKNGASISSLLELQGYQERRWKDVAVERR